MIIAGLTLNEEQHMPSTIDEIRTDLETRLTAARDAQDVRNAQIEYLGKKGTVTALLKQISAVAEDQRRQFGEQVNVLKQWACLLYTSDAADDLLCVDLGGRRIIK